MMFITVRTQTGLLGMVKLEFRDRAVQQHTDGGQLPKAILCLNVWSFQCEGPGQGLELLDGGSIIPNNERDTTSLHITKSNKVFHGSIYILDVKPVIVLVLDQSFNDLSMYQPYRT